MKIRPRSIAILGLIFLAVLGTGWYVSGRISQSFGSETIKYHFLGQVRSIDTSTEGKLMANVSQDSHQWRGENNGLFEGYKGDIWMETRECNLRKNISYSFSVFFNVKEGTYSCLEARFLIPGQF